MTHFNTRLRAAALASGLLAIAPATLYAQTPPEEKGPPLSTQEPAQGPAAAEAAPATTVPEAKIDQFATAYVAVQSIQAQTSQQLEATTDTKKAEDLKANAETQMIQAVEKSGLKVDEFNQIAGLMASDLTLRNKVLEKVQQRSRG
jgi:hypothetical protein